MEVKSNQPTPARAPAPEDFCEHEQHPCLFCEEMLHIGHDASGGDIVMHERPSCDVFQHCDDVQQFTLVSVLKYKADLDQRDRN